MDNFSQNHIPADETRSTKYEDTSLHIHRETVTYTLPQNHRNNGQTPNGYLPHQGIAVTPAEEEKVGRMYIQYKEFFNYIMQK